MKLLEGVMGRTDLAEQPGCRSVIKLSLAKQVMASGLREGELPGSGNSWAKDPLEEMSVQGTESRPEQPALAEAQRGKGMNLGQGQLERWAGPGQS